MGRRHQQSESGFTFIEIMVALLILAAAAGALMGMQGAALARTIRDSEAQQAMLLARRVMSSIEMNGGSDPIDSFDAEPALNTLRRFNIPEPTEQTEKDLLAPFMVSLLAEDFELPIPNIGQEPMKSITLRISWGADVDELFTVNYMMAIQKQQ